jgi:hypothetical protein
LNLSDGWEQSRAHTCKHWHHFPAFQAFPTRIIGKQGAKRDRFHFVAAEAGFRVSERGFGQDFPGQVEVRVGVGAGCPTARKAADLHLRDRRFLANCKLTARGDCKMQCKIENTLKESGVSGMSLTRELLTQ